MFDSFFLQTEAPILQQEAPAPTQPHECNVKHEPKNGGQKPHHHHANLGGDGDACKMNDQPKEGGGGELSWALSQANSLLSWI